MHQGGSLPSATVSTVVDFDSKNGRRNKRPPLGKRWSTALWVCSRFIESFSLRGERCDQHIWLCWTQLGIHSRDIIAGNQNWTSEPRLRFDGLISKFAVGSGERNLQKLACRDVWQVSRSLLREICPPTVKRPKRFTVVYSETCTNPDRKSVV